MMLKKALFYLGLGSDEEYEQYDDRVAGGGYSGAGDRYAPNTPNAQNMRQGPGSATVRPIMPAGSSEATLRPVAAVEDSMASHEAPGRAQATLAGESAVRIVDDPPTRPSAANPHTASPTNFEEAPRIGERLKAGQPVILNLQNAERGIRRRLLDFASGACYALGGRMERVADQVFLITPPEVAPPAAQDAAPIDEGFAE